MKRSASALLLIAAVVLLYRKVTRLWWTYDDAWLLHRALDRDWTETFRHGDASHHLFTPFLDSTFEALLAFRGLHPEVFYRFQLGVIAGCAVALFFALRQYSGTLESLAGALLFTAGVPLCTFATELMVVHYVEAILLGTLAVVAFVSAARRGSNLLNLLSALLYFAAMLAKEVAIPLPLLLLVLPERNWRVRLRHLVLHGIAAVVYFIWRRQAIGTLFGGYGWVLAPSDLPLLLVTLPWKILRGFTGASLAIGIVAVAVMVAGAVPAMRNRRVAIIAGAGLLLAAGPIALVSKDVSPQVAGVPWLWLCAAFTAGVATMKPATRGAVIAAALAAVVVANRQQWTAEYAHSLRMSDEARVYMTLDSLSLLRRPAIPPAAIAELQWLKEMHFHQARGTGWFYDDLFLCAPSLFEGKKIFEYNAARREVQEVTARIPDFARAWCGSIRATAPLRAEFHHRGESLFWRFGPYDKGRWTVVFAGGVQAFEVPPKEGFELAGVPGLALRVRYDAPDGWVTYSPDLFLDFAKQPDFEWHR